MPDPSAIFARHRLTIGQLRAVADRRYGDAVALVETGDNARANGAQYLAGIVIEILLKGQLLKIYPGIARQGSHEVSAADRPIWNLVWRSHDLLEILDRLPLLRVALKGKSAQAGVPYFEWLSAICNRWTFHARYSSFTSTIAEAREMVARVRVLKELIV